MKRIISLLFTGFVLLTVTNSCYKDDISNLESRLDTQENSSIPSINQQISSILSTLGLLQDADKDIKGLISNLQSTATELQKSLNSTNSKIDDNRTEVIGLLNELRSTTDGRLAEINLLIQYLQAKDDSLSQKIISVQNYVDNKSNQTVDWITATFATLEQYDSLSSDIAAINVSIEAINNSIVEMEQRVNTKISTDIAQAMINMSGALKDSITNITKAYSSAIATAKKEIEDAYTTAIQSAITASETSMKSWVNEQLSGYYTIAEADAKSDAMMITVGTLLNTQKAELEASIQSLSVNSSIEFGKRDSIIAIINEKIDSVEAKIEKNKVAITTLKSDLAKQKTEITAAYQSAIATAINDLDGKLDSITEAKVVAINKSIVDGINARLDVLEADVVTIKTNISNIFTSITTINTNIATLAKRIQSMLYIPEFDDGTIPVRRTSTNLGGTTSSITFKVSPKEAIDDLDISWNQSISMKAFGSKATKASLFIDMPIVSYSSNKTDGTISIVAAGANLEQLWTEGVTTLNAFISVSDGNTSFDTQLVYLIPTISANAVDLGLSVLWSDCCYLSLTTTSGKQMNYPSNESIYYNCGEGWRIPTKQEWQELYTLSKKRTNLEAGNVLDELTATNGSSIAVFGNSYWTSTIHSQDAQSTRNEIIHTSVYNTKNWKFEGDQDIKTGTLGVRLVKDK